MHDNSNNTAIFRVLIIEIYFFGNINKVSFITLGFMSVCINSTFIP